MILDAALPPPPPAETIIVTGRLLPDPASERAFSVERIGQDRLRNAPTTQLEEVLRQVPGLQLFRRSDARSGHPTSQGVTLRALGGNASSRALLILDGVPQTDPFGGWINWPAYDPATLAEIRVIRGGGSVTAGPGALAGTIEMKSNVDDGVVMDFAGGSRQSAEGRASMGAELGRGRFLISAKGGRGDGFIPITKTTRGPADRAAGYREGNARALWLTPLANDLELQASASGFIDRRSRGLAFTDNCTEGIDAALRLIGQGQWQWSALGYAQWREFESSFASIDAGRTKAQRVSLQDSVPGRALGAAIELRPPMPRALELRLGADARAADGESRELYSYVAGNPTRRRRAGGQTATAGLFGDISADLGRLTLSGGARIDHWRVSDGRLTEWTIATGANLRDDQFKERSGWLPTARAGAVFQLSSPVELRSAAYLGWRMPTLNELFRPFRVGSDATAANPLLDPERLAGVEGGIGYRSGGLSLAATAFANHLGKAIANVTLGKGPGQFPGVGFVPAGGEFRQRRNLKAIDVRGVEASAGFTHGPWSLRGGLSFTDAKVNADGPAEPLDGLRPAQTPRWVITGGLDWERDRRAVSVVVRHSGQQFEDDLNRQSLRAATTLDAFAAWPLTRDLQVTARAENLLNARVVAGIGGDGSVERATPRTLWLDIRFRRPAPR